ncbi:MAG: hypothetical protein U0821_05910 [Chloroflexota bacterium]
MELTERERNALTAIRTRLDQLAEYVTSAQRPDEKSSLLEWYAYLADLKTIQGNTSNDTSLVATLMARDYLSRVLPMQPFDAAAKPQGAPGLDIDERTVDGKRVIAEIKTTRPYLGKELGVQQKATFKHDFDKLNAAVKGHPIGPFTGAASHVFGIGALTGGQRAHRVQPRTAHREAPRRAISAADAHKRGPVTVTTASP